MRRSAISGPLHSRRSSRGRDPEERGRIRETAIERMARDARVQSIDGGATEVMLEEIATRMA